MKITKIVFWDPCLSPHKADFIQELAILNKDIEIVLCAHEEIPSYRRDLGWSLNLATDYVQIIAPSEIIIKDLCLNNSENTLHVFSGIHWVPTILSAIKFVRKSGANFCIMMEPRVTEGWKGILRIIHSRVTEYWFRKNTSFVLGIGRNGSAWFKLAGYENKLIYPFAYFIKDNITSEETKIVDNKIKIAYIGRLIEMKGVADLIDAVGMLTLSYNLKIVGNGEAINKFKMKASDNSSVQFLGVLPIKKISNFLNEIDILVLPSRSMDDGWGVVVTEGLLSGCVVIASECVGASIVLENNILNGAVVSAYSPQQIAEKILEQIEYCNLSIESRIKRRNWALKHLTANAGAAYFMKIIQHHFDDASRPNPFYK